MPVVQKRHNIQWCIITGRFFNEPCCGKAVLLLLDRSDAYWAVMAAAKKAIWQPQKKAISLKFLTDKEDMLTIYVHVAFC